MGRETGKDALEGPCSGRKRGNNPRSKQRRSLTRRVGTKMRISSSVRVKPEESAHAHLARAHMRTRA